MNGGGGSEEETPAAIVESYPIFELDVDNQIPGGRHHIEDFFHHCRIETVSGQESALFDVEVIGSETMNVVRYNQPVTTWSQYAEANLPEMYRATHDDPDGDGLVNLGEYKLGQPALHFSQKFLKVEPEFANGGSVPSGWWLRWSERTDRGEDVKTYPQVLRRDPVITDSTFGNSSERPPFSYARYWVSDGFGEVENADGSNSGSGGSGSNGDLTGGGASTGGNSNNANDGDNIQELKVFYANADGLEEAPDFQLFFELEVDPDNTQDPNVVMIMVDDLNDWVSCLGGHPDVDTPNIDRLARRGMLFTNAHTPGPICHVARAAIMAGLRPGTTWLNDNNDWMRDYFNKDNPRIANSLPGNQTLQTLPQYMKNQGYAIRATGKMYHGMVRDADLQEAESVAQWNNTWYVGGNRASGSYYKEWQKNASDPTKYSYKPYEMKPSDDDKFFSTLGGAYDFGVWELLPNYNENKLTSDEQLAIWANEYLIRGIDPHPNTDKYKHVEDLPVNQPKFLTFGIFRPHLPFYSPKRNYVQSNDEIVNVVEPASSLSSNKSNVVKTLVAESPLNPNFSDHERMDTLTSTINGNKARQEAVHGYIAAVQHADEQIGLLLDGIDQMNNLKPSSDADGPEVNRNTWIILISDHGFHCGEKRHWKKQTLWGRSTRIPMIVVAPGLTRPGSICRQPVGSLDIYRTLTAKLGPTTHVLDGGNLLEILTDPENGTRLISNSDSSGFGPYVVTDHYRKDIANGLFDYDDEDNQKEKPVRLWASSVVSPEYRYIAYKVKRLNDETCEYEYEIVEELYTTDRPREIFTHLNWPTVQDGSGNWPVPTFRDPPDNLTVAVVEELRTYLPTGFFSLSDHTGDERHDFEPYNDPYDK